MSDLINFAIDAAGGLERFQNSSASRRACTTPEYCGI
jgi:hypothetical protein